ncbi:putative kinesin heavy chain [Cryptosporidium canis]|uniref:Kinesin-like protein n=1 Tax=Cryptosporidium canis TaxID=195482 RepID=A0ABQ8P9B0_9CRYT|nr:putative kinesin heavy chain [Cryptosporidium canis]KAJ1613318.1 putative kinesin heavy chain [Cryptosporidium canis]
MAENENVGNVENVPRSSGSNSDHTTGSGVHVYCRVRPPNEAEKTHGNGLLCVNVRSEQCIEISSAESKSESEAKERTFYLDHIFPMDTTQSYVYKTAAKPIVDQLFKGINGTVLAYGQTSSGKTFTMEGIIGDNEKMGVIPRMVHDVFETISNAEEHIEFQLKVSICEVYMERIRDLLDTSGTKSNLRIHEDKIHGIYVKDLSEYFVTSPEEVFELMALGHKHRAVASTNMNSYSSRSHLIFMLQLQQKNVFDSSIKVGKLFLVDLAGSEKISKTGAEGLTLDEAKTINKSLSCLGNVINALTDNTKNFVPYRDSKLTRILQNSLGGNSLTALIVTCSPSIVNESETIGTLRFGIRAKMVKNAPKVNQQFSVEQLQVLLNSAQRKLAERDNYIKVLEDLVKKLGGELPENKPCSDKGASLVLSSSLNIGDGEKKESHETSPTSEKTTLNLRQLDNDELDELDEAKQQLKENSEKITQLKQEISDKDNTLKIISEEKENLNIKVSDLVQELNQVKYQQQDQAETVEHLQLKNKSLVGELEQSQIHIHDLEVRIEGFKSEELQRKNEERESEAIKAYQSLSTEIQQLREYLLAMRTSSDVKDKDIWSSEQKALLETIEDNVAKIANLEIQLKESSKSNKKFDINDQDTKNMLERMSQLDTNMEQLGKLYQKMVEQNANLKSQSQLNERRLQRKEERIEQLERSLINAKTKYTKLLMQCNSLTKTIENISKLKPIFAKLAPPNIVKGIQGGGGKSSLVKA